MSASIQFLNAQSIPSTGFLAIPGRLDLQQLLHLEKEFQGRTITFLIEESDFYDPALRSHMERSERGAMFSIKDENPAAAGQQLAGFLKNNGILLFVGKPYFRYGVKIVSADKKIIKTKPYYPCIKKQ